MSRKARLLILFSSLVISIWFFRMLLLGYVAENLISYLFGRVVRIEVVSVNSKHAQIREIKIPSLGLTLSSVSIERQGQLFGAGDLNVSVERALYVPPLPLPRTKAERPFSALGVLMKLKELPVGTFKIQRLESGTVSEPVLPSFSLEVERKSGVKLYVQRGSEKILSFELGDSGILRGNLSQDFLTLLGASGDLRAAQMDFRIVSASTTGVSADGGLTLKMARGTFAVDGQTKLITDDKDLLSFEPNSNISFENEGIQLKAKIADRLQLVFEPEQTFLKNSARVNFTNSGIVANKDRFECRQCVFNIESLIKDSNGIRLRAFVEVPFVVKNGESVEVNQGELEVRLSPSSTGTTVEVLAKKASGSFGNLPFRTLNLATNAQLQTEPVVEFDISAEEVGSTLQLQNLRSAGKLSFKNEAPNMLLHYLSADFLGGRINGMTNGKNADLCSAMKFSIVNVALEEIAALYPQSGLSASGRIVGDFPVQYCKDGWRMSGGKLSAPKKGWIKLAARPETGNSAADFAFKALEDFVYEQLSADVSLTPDGAMELSFKLEGLSRSLNKNAPLVVNLNVEENLWALLKSFSIAGKINRQLSERYSTK